MSRGDLSTADQYLAQAAEIDRSMGTLSAGGYLRRSRRARLGGDLSGSRHEIRGYVRQFGPTSSAALTEAGLTEAAAGRNEIAARLFGMGDRALSDVKGKHVSSQREQMEATRAQVRASLSADAFDREYQYGYELDRDTTLALLEEVMADE